MKSIYTLGSLVLDYNADARGGSELEIKRKALEVKERKLDLDREKFEAAEARLAAATAAISRLKESGGISEEARKEIEKAMGLL